MEIDCKVECGSDKARRRGDASSIVERAATPLRRPLDAQALHSTSAHGVEMGSPVLPSLIYRLSLFLFTLSLLVPATVSAESQTGYLDQLAAQLSGEGKPSFTTYAVELRPFFAASDSADLGAVGELRLRHQFDVPLAIDLELSPLGWLGVEGRNIFVSDANLTVSYSIQYLEFGLGAGVTRVLARQNYYVESERRPPAARISSALSFYARAGRLDSSYISMKASLVPYFNGWHEGAINMAGQLYTPWDRGWLVGGLGWTRSGYRYIEFGPRFRLRGDNGPGSIFLTFQVGIARLQNTTVFSCNRPGWDHQSDQPTTVDRYCVADNGIYGLQTNIGLEWRR